MCAYEICMHDLTHITHTHVRTYVRKYGRTHAVCSVHATRLKLTRHSNPYVLARARARLAIPARGLGLMHNAGQRPAAQTMQAKDRLRKWVVGRYSRDREMTYIFDAKLTDDAWRSMLTQTHVSTHPCMRARTEALRQNVKQNNMLSIHSANKIHEHTHQCDLNPSDENAPSGPE
jgi:hypothetical protein